MIQSQKGERGSISKLCQRPMHGNIPTAPARARMPAAGQPAHLDGTILQRACTGRPYRAKRARGPRRFVGIISLLVHPSLKGDSLGYASPESLDLIQQETYGYMHLSRREKEPRATYHAGGSAAEWGPALNQRLPTKVLIRVVGAGAGTSLSSFSSVVIFKTCWPTSA